MTIKLREGNLEFRNTETLLKESYFEIVKWVEQQGEDDYCFTVASWVKTRVGYELRFCANRPFEEDFLTFMNFAYKGQKVLDTLNEA